MASEAELARRAKAMVALAFRDGPIEDVHAGKTCPTCRRAPEYSGITNAEMKTIMKTAVDRVYTMLRLQQEEPENFEELVTFGMLSASRWDNPEPDTRLSATSELLQEMKRGRDSREAP